MCAFHLLVDMLGFGCHLRGPRFNHCDYRGYQRLYEDAPTIPVITDHCSKFAERLSYIGLNHQNFDFDSLHGSDSCTPRPPIVAIWVENWRSHLSANGQNSYLIS